jgi:multiple sugar transport system permease protein
MSTATTQAVGSHKQKDWPKHLVIWSVLAIDLLPFYMMVQISFKDNTTFNLNPWFPTNPLTWVWSNWTYGIELIGPYIANTVFVAVTTTTCTLFLAIMAAYFFARYKMPFGSVLWSAFIVLMLMPGVANIVPLFSLLKDLNLLNTLWALIIVGVAGGQVLISSCCATSSRTCPRISSRRLKWTEPPTSSRSSIS